MAAEHLTGRVRRVPVTDPFLAPRYRLNDAMLVDQTLQPEVGDEVIATSVRGELVGRVVSLHSDGCVTLEMCGQGMAVTLPPETNLEVIVGALFAKVDI